MIETLPPYILYLLAIAASFVVSVYAVKKIIFITRDKKIFDIPDNIRKIHGAQIPSLGGIGIFVGYVVVSAFFIFSDNSRWNYILISSVILFFTGVYDDVANMRPLKKLLAQLIAAAISVHFAIMAINNGMLPVPNIWMYGLSVAVITIACTFFINAFNFIDGIDGLACTLAILYTVILALLFAADGQVATAAIIFSLTGATAGLLYYNKSPAKIYMGDTGSMVLGFNIFIFSALYLFTNKTGGTFPSLIILAILFLPAYDAIRVFILRLSKGISPLKADRAHLHYYLLDAGFTHTKSVLIILFCNIAIISFSLLLRAANLLIIIAALTVLASAMLLVIYKLRQKKLLGLPL